MVSVLYVDDEPDLLEIGKLFLEEGGQFQVDVITSATEALTTMQSKAYDAIISDYQMPGMDGIEFLKNVRASGNTIPFIIFTGKGREEIVIQAINEGADFYLQKGGDPESQFAELQHKVRMAVLRRTAESSLVKGQEQHQEILQTAMDGYMLLDTKGNILEVNKAYCLMSGYSQQELLLMSISDLKATESTEDPTIHIRNIIPQGKARFESKHRRKDGSALYLEINAHYHPANGGRVIAFLNNITERKKKEEEMIFKNTILSTQQETSPDGILIVDDAGKILQFNQKFINIWGIPSGLQKSTDDEPILQYVVDQVTDPEAFLSRVRYLYAHKEEKSFEELQLRNGRILERFSAPMLAESGKYFGRVWYFRDITERKQAEDAIRKKNQELNAAYEQLAAGEEELRQNYQELASSQRALAKSEEKFRTVADFTYDWEYWLSPAGEIIYTSPSCENLSGYSAQELTADPTLLERMVHEDDRPVYNTHNSRIQVERDIIHQEEFRIQTKEGQERWIGHVCNPVYGTDGSYRGRRACNRDITERKHAEEALNETSKRLSFALRSAKAGTWNWDFPTGKLVWSPEFFDLFGIPPEVIPSFDSWLDHLHPDDRTTAMEKTNQSVAEHRDLWNEYRVVLPDGTIRWIGASGSTTFNDSNEPLRMSGVCIDITERKLSEEEVLKKTEQLSSAYEELLSGEEELRQNYQELAVSQRALEESEEKYRTLFKTAADGIVVHDTQGRNIDVNAMACEMLGYSHDELLSMKVSDLIPPEELQKNPPRLAEARGGQPVCYERKLRRKDGTLLDVEIRASRFTEGMVQAFWRDITERKRTEEKNRQLLLSVELEKEKLSSLINSITDEIWFTDTEHQFTLANPRARSEFGLNQEEKTNVETLAKSVEVLRPDGTPRPLEEAPPLRALAGEVVKNIDEIVRTPAHGELRYRQVSAAPVKDGAGNIIGAVSVVRDVTTFKHAEEEIKKKNEELYAAYEQLTAIEEELRQNFDDLGRSERALRESEEKYRLIADNADDWIYWITPDGTFRYVSPSCERVTGYSMAEFHDHPQLLQEIVHPADQEILQHHSLKALVENEPDFLEFRIITKNGMERWIGHSCNPVYTNEGQYAGRRGTNRNITERKRAEEELRLSEEMFSNAFQSGPAGMTITRVADGKFIDANKSFLRMFEFSRDEVVGHTSIEVNMLTPEERVKLIDEQIKSGGVHDFELLARSKSGRLINLLLSSRPMEMHGETHHITTMIDITERKLAEAALLEAHRDLEKKVIERTRELSDANLRLQELDRLKSMFIASMSHELRTPLNSIIGFTGIILKGMTGEINQEQKKQLGMVQESARHLLALINDVIDISKIEAGKIEVNISTFDLSEVIRQVSDSQSPVAEEVGLVLDMEIPGPMLITSDERRITQIILNLVSNAVKFTDKGRIDVKFRQEGDTVEIRIRDTGIGIRQQDLPLLFRPFSRVIVPGRLTEGTGLGLYLSQKLAGFLGGKITVQSELHKGSEFVFSFPVTYKKQEDV